MNFLTYLSSIWTNITTAFNSTCSVLEEVVDRINAVTLSSSDNPLLLFFGTIRYLLGDTFYTLIISIIYISAGFMLYGLASKLVEYFKDWISNMFNKSTP